MQTTILGAKIFTQIVQEPLWDTQRDTQRQKPSSVFPALFAVAHPLKPGLARWAAPIPPPSRRAIQYLQPRFAAESFLQSPGEVASGRPWASCFLLVPGEGGALEIIL